MWDSYENLRCEGPNCSSQFLEKGSKDATRAGARAHGWHLSDEEWRPHAHICPSCLKVPRSRLPSTAEPMAEDVPLFEVAPPAPKADRQ